jgi:membrane protein YdbS with pleckstrin-like domain
MAKLDEIKEILNTLRIWLSLTIGLIVLTVSGLIKRYDIGNVDWIFYSGSFLFFVLIFVVLLIIIKISTRTKQIKDL